MPMDQLLSLSNESSLSNEVKEHGSCAYAYPQWQSEVDHIDIY